MTGTSLEAQPAGEEAAQQPNPRPARRGIRKVLGRREGMLVVPLVGFLLIFFAYPAVEILLRSWSEFTPPQAAGLDNYRWFFDTPVNLTVLNRTVVASVVVAVLCLIIGYPYAYLMTLVSPRMRAAMLGIVIISGFTSLMVRNYAWLVILQDEGPLNDILSSLGFGRVSFVGSLSGVYIVLTQIMLPLMILPLYATMRGIDRRLLLAAESLGGRPLRAFARVYVPLSMPGAFAGTLLVFVLTLGFYITPALIGSPANALFSQLIYDQITQLLAWGRASVMGIVLLVVAFVIIALFAWFGRRINVDGAGSGDLGLADREGRARLTLGRKMLYGSGILIALWLILPMLIVIPQSFSGTSTLAFPPESFSTQWYTALFDDPAWMDSILRSLGVGVVVCLASTVLGTAAAFGLVRGNIPGAAGLNAFILSPMVVPLIVFAVGIYAVFLNWHLVGTFLGFFLAHLALAVPFVVVTVTAGLRTFDRRLEHAAQTLGASRFKIARTITLPLLMPSILTGALFALMVSLDEVVVSLFISSPTVKTLPVQMFQSVIRSVDPTMAAAATLILAVTIAVMVVGAVAQNRRRHLA